MYTWIMIKHVHESQMLMMPLHFFSDEDVKKGIPIKTVWISIYIQILLLNVYWTPTEKYSILFKE